MAAAPHLQIDSRDPFERGRQRGSWAGDAIRRTWPIYEGLFAVTARDAGRRPVDVPAVADACLDALATWSPDLLRELEGVAAGSGLDLQTVMALNARTEVLAHAQGDRETECSTLVQLGASTGRAIGAQTWDWHHDLADGWHLQTVIGDEYTFAGLTEYGLLAKIGVNEAGLGLHFNLLRHESDAGGGYDVAAAPLGGVPVHLIARAVLGRASTVSQAIELIRSAPVAASTVLTVLTPTDAASVEISPAGVGVIHPRDGWVVHTNHFLDAVLAEGEGVDLDLATTFEREEVLWSRIKEVDEPLDAERLVSLLCGHGDGEAVCRHVDELAPFGYRTATLATVVIDAARRVASVSAGGPCRRTQPTEVVARA